MLYAYDDTGLYCCCSGDGGRLLYHLCDDAGLYLCCIIMTTLVCIVVLAGTAGGY